MALIPRAFFITDESDGSRSVTLPRELLAYRGRLRQMQPMQDSSLSIHRQVKVTHGWACTSRYLRETENPYSSFDRPRKMLRKAQRGKVRAFCDPSHVPSHGTPTFPVCNKAIHGFLSIVLSTRCDTVAFLCWRRKSGQNPRLRSLKLSDTFIPRFRKRSMHRCIASVSGTKRLVRLRDNAIVVDDVAKSVEGWTHRNANVELRARTTAEASLKPDQSRLS